MKPRDFERLRGGLWCHEVLDRLGDYVDGDLSDVDRSQVEAHVADCDGCARFGAAYGAMVRAIRPAAHREAAEPDPGVAELDPGVAERLVERLRAME